MKKHTQKLMSIILIAIILYVGFSFFAGKENIRDLMGGVSPLYITVACLLAVSNYLLRFARWQYFLSRLGVSIGLWESFLIFLSGLAMSVTPAKVGELYKAHLGARESGAPTPRIVSVVVVERLVDVISLCLLAIMSYSAISVGGYALVIVLAACLAGVFVIRKNWAINWIERFTRKRGWLESGVKSFHSGLVDLLSPRVLGGSVLISMLSWGCECTALWVIMRGFGVSESPLLAFFVFSVSTLAGALAMIPGGLGVTEGGMAGLLVLAGVGEATAIGVMMVTRLCTLWLGVFLGLVALGVYTRTSARRRLGE